MKKMQLGGSGELVSCFSLGALPFGTKVSEPVSFAILDRYAEAGGSFLDTANNYSLWHANGKGGESETVLGSWMKARSNRSDMFVATKAGFNNPEIGISLSEKTIRQEVDGSLKRLQSDYIDLFYAHTDSRGDALEETLATMNDLVDQGKIRHIGCSNYRAWRIEKAVNISRHNGWAEYCCVQQRFSYLRPRAGADFSPQLSANDDLLDFCTETSSVRMLAYSPLLNGAYTREDRDFPEQYISGETEGRLSTLNRVAESHSATANQIIYAWMIQGAPGIIPLVAPTTLEQLRDSLGALDVVLAEDEIEELSE